MYNKNLILIIIAQIFGFTAAPVTIFLSGIIGSTLTSFTTLSTLPTASMVIGLASSTMIASKIMSRIGRKRGFIYAAIYTSISSLIAAISIYYGSFLFYCLSCFAIGNGLAFTHQYRFAAAESVSEDMIPRAISVIMLAGIFSALLGPNIAVYSQNLIPEHTFVGPYIALSFMTFLPVLSLMFYSPSGVVKGEKKIIAGRTYGELLGSHRFSQAIIVAAMSYAIMSFLMTATPLSMHHNHGFSLESTKIVIQFHIIAMFLPSLFTGRLIKKFGHSRIIYTGVLFFLLTIFSSYFETTYINFLIALTFLGIGWNFLFITSTSLLVISYREEEKFKAQGFNEIVVFSMQAIASLSAGFMLTLVGWEIMNVLCVPLSFLVILMTLRADISEKKSAQIIINKG
ncbi:MAG: MFS transporter [Hyphomicrobiales bacterium]|nr:MFS transporter [Rhodobiaceae bacterium]OUT81915.1 MAG: MFS transporter [Rhizobiales bacterium TMED28]RZO33938.1 MAG: MFS transporter [Hyphomicrobiales bacterium]